jgi:hypothetical protein
MASLPGTDLLTFPVAGTYTRRPVYTSCRRPPQIDGTDMLRSLVFGTLLATALAASVVAQHGPVHSTRTAEAHRPAPAPFGVGEQATYRVGFGIIRNVGSGSMKVVAVDTVRGHPSYHMQFRLQGGIPGARVNNRFDSWLDAAGLFSRRFEQDTHEVRYKRQRTREFFPEERRWTGRTNDRIESGELPTAAPLDETAFLFFVRTLRLEPGDQYTLNNYWNEDGNPVRIRVLRRETVEVPAGRFNTVVLQPIIQTSGLFSDGGEAEVYLSDDAARVLVMLKAKVSFGTLRLELEDYRPGRPLSSDRFVPRPPAR